MRRKGADCSDSLPRSLSLPFLLPCSYDLVLLSPSPSLLSPTSSHAPPCAQNSCEEVERGPASSLGPSGQG